MEKTHTECHKNVFPTDLQLCHHQGCAVGRDTHFGMLHVHFANIIYTIILTAYLRHLPLLHISDNDKVKTQDVMPESGNINMDAIQWFPSRAVYCQESGDMIRTVSNLILVKQLWYREHTAICIKSE